MKDHGLNRDRFIDAAFALGMVLAIVPDFFIASPFPNTPHYWLNLANTAMDGLLFLTVFVFLKREIAKRRAANAQLSLANRQKTEFLQIASHDLRNPLNAILLLASQVPPDPAEGPDDPAKRISEEANDMLSIIGELIDATALGDGSLQLHRAPADLAECVAEVVARNRPQARLKNQELSFEKTAPLPVVVDAARIRQAIDNLVSNAIKFSPVGKPISVTAVRHGDRARIEVTDEGPGLSETDKSTLFLRYQRLTARPTAGESSIGLGLFNARRLVELNGGTIGAKSEGIGLGSRFWIELPLPPSDSEAVRQG